MTRFRLIPSIEQLQQRPALSLAASTQGAEVVTRALRAAAATLRDALARDEDPLPATTEDAARWVESRALDAISRHAEPSLRRVINATGVIIHTNLGRAPLATAAVDQAAKVAAGYSNLEYDLAAGARGSRHAHAERLLLSLTGAEAAVVVNNAAAAALLTMAALARGRDVLISRGELVEIGGGFRVPDVLAQSGAVLREVGTTNRTRVSDYAAAITDRTALILRVHPSNFRIEGFVERPELRDLAALARRFSVPLVEDLGSGWLGVDPSPPALAGEPSVPASISAGADVVLFSGDKLLGGPQAGLIVGRRTYMDTLRAHPLMRALRVDKLTYAALEATLGLWATVPSREHLPILQMLTMTPEAIEARARQVALALAHVRGLRIALRDGQSTIGGGSSPGSSLPTCLLAISIEGTPAAQLARRLRSGTDSVITRIEEEQVLLDLRTVLPDEDARLIDALAQAVAQSA
jgi:L-seryl-tRNA(Ser) seleniumtransferase